MADFVNRSFVNVARFGVADTKCRGRRQTARNGRLFALVRIEPRPVCVLRLRVHIRAARSFRLLRCTIHGSALAGQR